MLIFRTPTGSRLYGTATPESDYDFMEVYLDNRKTTHTITGKQDVTQCSLGSFLKYVAKGSPQNLEALYSPYNTATFLKDHVHPDYYGTINTYSRTIKSFYHHPTRRRDAYRLYLNLQEFIIKGRFNPCIDLSELQRVEEEGILDSWII
jgi:predicted nucleotidyltransferase